MGSFDLTTETGLRRYLKANGQSDDIGISLLTGGNCNYVYRVSEPQGSTSIYKHAARCLHSVKGVALDPIRMNYEAHALKIFANIHDENLSSKTAVGPIVQAARFISYDEKNKLLCISDGGNRNLKDAYDDLALEIHGIGQELAKWIATIHTSSTDTSLGLPGQGNGGHTHEKNNPIAVAIYRHSYMNLHAAFAEYGHDTQLADKINEDYGSLLSSDDECVCHGDFWPGNILVRIHESADKPIELTVVDWEIVRRGTSATDVGQFSAEAFLLDRFQGNRGLLAAFLDTYLDVRFHDTTLINRTWLKRMIVHWAVHVAFWPTFVSWTDREGTQKLVDIGVGVLRDVLDDNWEKLLDSPLLKDAKERWVSVSERC